MNPHHATFRLAGTVSVGPKGQVVIPAEVRELMHIQTGDKLIALYVTAKMQWPSLPNLKRKNWWSI
ncbi:AbrB/MazE/SpoVT family DNA-binding domain-containing protein [bacterium]|nr:MAG: AbrB/MazE/SpoVT family DNA-binding domain-containing protein [bacterium]